MPLCLRLLTPTSTGASELCSITASCAALATRRWHHSCLWACSSAYTMPCTQRWKATEAALVQRLNFWRASFQNVYGAAEGRSLDGIIAARVTPPAAALWTAGVNGGQPFGCWRMRTAHAPAAYFASPHPRGVGHRVAGSLRGSLPPSRASVGLREFLGAFSESRTAPTHQAYMC